MRQVTKTFLNVSTSCVVMLSKILYRWWGELSVKGGGDGLFVTRTRAERYK